jgi:hypothetical protein
MTMGSRQLQLTAVRAFRLYMLPWWRHGKIGLCTALDKNYVIFFRIHIQPFFCKIWLRTFSLSISL